MAEGARLESVYSSNTIAGEERHVGAPQGDLPLKAMLSTAKSRGRAGVTKSCSLRHNKTAGQKVGSFIMWPIVACAVFLQGLYR